jgi:hypothetical protein
VIDAECFYRVNGCLVVGICWLVNKAEGTTRLPTLSGSQNFVSDAAAKLLDAFSPLFCFLSQQTVYLLSQQHITCFHNIAQQNKMQNTKNTAPDPAAVDPMITGHRRAFIKSYFQHYGIWDESGWESLLKKTEDKVCQLLATAKYVKVNHASFVFEAEKLAWGKHGKSSLKWDIS